MSYYNCRLVMRIQADFPEDAPGKFVENLTRAGLINWIFRVEDPDTFDILGYYDGEGNEVDMASILAASEESEATPVAPPMPTSPATPNPIEDVPLPPEPSTAATPYHEYTDQELLALAERLGEESTAEDQTSEPTSVHEN